MIEISTTGPPCLCVCVYTAMPCHALPRNRLSTTDDAHEKHTSYIYSSALRINVHARAVDCERTDYVTNLERRSLFDINDVDTLVHRVVESKNNHRVIAIHFTSLLSHAPARAALLKARQPRASVRHEKMVAARIQPRGDE